ncbi:tol-pal system protein YbgF [Halomonas cibimaris]|uniref:Cell division coordinator CpoB n=1 Tax=Halomonas cibimaris TaxID=657012 RepID=A0ABP7LTZ4_9GAMM
MKPSHLSMRPLHCLMLAVAVWPVCTLAQQPAAQHLSGSPDGFYDQTETRRSPGSLVLFNQIQEQQRELKELRGGIEELRHALEKLRRQSQKRYLDLDQRLANTTGAGAAASQEASTTSETSANEASAPDAQAKSDAAGQSDRPAQSSQAADKQAQKAYQTAFAHVQAREFDQAITAFQQFVSDYPDTRLTPNGYYWLGELYAAGDQLDAADQAFTRVIEQHTQSSKMPDAMYKLGLMKARQGNIERSRELLEQVQQDYPQSSAAGLASDYLRQSAD